jgi:hypothetical protein
MSKSESASAIPGRTGRYRAAAVAAGVAAVVAVAAVLGLLAWALAGAGAGEFAAAVVLIGAAVAGLSPEVAAWRLWRK